MEAYATVPPDDPFTVSRAMFAALAAELAGPAAAGLTASGLEELLDERGAPGPGAQVPTAVQVLEPGLAGVFGLSRKVPVGGVTKSAVRRPRRQIGRC